MTSEIKPLKPESNAVARYTALLAEAHTTPVPPLRAGDANAVLLQLAIHLDAPLPSVGTLLQHASAWQACFVDMGLGALIAGVSPLTLSVFFLLCWREKEAYRHSVHDRVLTAAMAGMGIQQFNKQEARREREAAMEVSEGTPDERDSGSVERLDY